MAGRIGETTQLSAITVKPASPKIMINFCFPIVFLYLLSKLVSHKFFIVERAHPSVLYPLNLEFFLC